MDDLIVWESRKRGDELPFNAIKTGTTKNDGELYVARVNGVPGKVNLDNNKIYNFWIQDMIKSSEYGEVLTLKCDYEWIEINRGDLIPINAVFSGRDLTNDKVWIGKNNEGEPGKINCHDNDSNEPKMHNFWCQSSIFGKVNTNAYILVLKPNIEPKNGNGEEWKSFNKYHYSKTIKENKLNIEIDEIAKNIFNIVQSINGNVLTLGTLVSELKLNLQSKSINENMNCELIKNINDESRLILLIKEEIIKKNMFCIGWCGCYTKYYNINIDYIILEPDNNIAKKRCKELTNLNINKLIDEFKDKTVNKNSY